MKWYIKVKNNKEVNYIFYSKCNTFYGAVGEFSPIRKLMYDGDYSHTWYTDRQIKENGITKNIVEVFGTKSPEDELDELLEEIYKIRTKL